MLKHLFLRMVRPFYKILKLVKGGVEYSPVHLDAPLQTLPITMVRKGCEAPDCDEYTEELLFFHVQKHTYLASYKRLGFLFDKYIHMYEIYGDMPEGLEPEVRDLYMQTVRIPRLLSWVHSDTEQLNAIIAFFLDMKVGKADEIMKRKKAEYAQYLSEHPEETKARTTVKTCCKSCADSSNEQSN